MQLCRQNPNATCCRPAPSDNANATVEAADLHCPLTNCETVVESHLHQAVNIVGCLGLIFSFTEVCRLHSSISVLLVMQRYIESILAISYRYCEGKYRNFDISLSFQYRRNNVDVVYLLSFFVGNQSVKLWVFTFLSRSSSFIAHH